MLLFLMPFILASVLLLFPFKSRTLPAYLLSLGPLTLLAFNASNWIGARVEHEWIPALSVKFILNVDSLSFLFILLTCLIVPISFFAINNKNGTPRASFYPQVFLLQGFLIGFFAAGDLALFTFFWEAMLIPIYFLMTPSGEEKQKTAAMKFLIFTIAGSTLMVAAVLAIYVIAGSFTIDTLAKPLATTPYTPYLCAIFLAAFAVKTPLFPFHSWLPDAYTESPVTATILLSALLSKAGIYGLLRIGIPFFSSQIEAWSLFLLSASIAGVLYGGFAAWMQTDFKRLIAYSSLSHVNFILAGIFIQTEVSTSGAILQAFNHGITIAALFLVAGWLEERTHTTQINTYGGLALYMPKLCWITLFFVLSSVALPGLNNFVGEILILFGFFGKEPWLVPLLAATIVISAIYMLRWMQKVYFENPSPKIASWTDLNALELFKIFPIILLVLAPGIYPAPLLTQTDKAAQTIFHEKD